MKMMAWCFRVNAEDDDADKNEGSTYRVVVLTGPPLKMTKCQITL